jgi:hypothetical protein
MSLNQIKKSDLVANNFSYGEHKGFDVYVELTRQGYKFSVGVMLDADSDARHRIGTGLETTLRGVRDEARRMIDSVFDMQNHYDADLDAASIVNLALMDVKKAEVRAITKPVYQVLMSAYRHAKALIITAMRHDPDNAREYGKRLTHINTQFDIQNIKPQGFDKYAPEFAFSWVINRAMDNMSLPAPKASSLAAKFQRLSLPHSTIDYVTESERVHAKNAAFYASVMKRYGVSQ